MDDSALIKDADVQEIVTKGQKIYDKLRPKYEPSENGKFLAIHVDNEDVFVGTTSAAAVELAKTKYPKKVFYVVKIGYDVAETLATAFNIKQ